MSRSQRIVQFTDTHLTAEPGMRLRGVDTLATLRACIEHASSLALPADAILLSGDLVHDDPAAYALLESLFAPLGLPVLAIAGNHDLPAELHRRLAPPTFHTRGALRFGVWRVLLLESWFAASAEGEGRLGAEALAELDRELQANADAPVLLALHHPPLRLDAVGLDELRLQDELELHALVERHPQVRGVVFGHAHQALDVLQGRVRWMCTPSTCFQFRTRSAGFESDARPPGYRIIDLLPDGGLVTEVFWIPQGGTD